MGRKKKTPTPNKETPEKVVSCHQCRHYHRESETISCTNNCVMVFGVDCLKRNYEETVLKDEKASWKCPRCRQICNCSVCNKIFSVQRELASLTAENVMLKEEIKDLKDTLSSKDKRVELLIKENTSLKIQLRDTAKAVLAAGELAKAVLVRLTEAEEADTAAQVPARV